MNGSTRPLVSRDHRGTQPVGLGRRTWPRSSTGRPTLAAFAVLSVSLTLAACGGGSSVSDVTPKSTPDITPPTDTTAEKAAVQTTSTSTTSTTSTSTPGEGSSSESSSGETSKSEAGESSSGESSSKSGAAGGTSVEEKEKASGESSKGTGESSPSGGASAPSGK